jgi:hypothetical protein
VRIRPVKIIGGSRGRVLLSETKRRETTMFKIIGAVVVYGFALLGLARYLESVHMSDDAS